MQADRVRERKPKTIELVIVYGVNKPVVDRPGRHDREAQARGARRVRDRPRPRPATSSCARRSTARRTSSSTRRRTVESYNLHNKQKVTLAAGTPFGAPPEMAGRRRFHELTPEEQSKALVRERVRAARRAERLLRLAAAALLDAGDFYVIFVRIAGGGGRVFV